MNAVKRPCGCGKKKPVETLKPLENGKQTDKPADSGGG
jgi:hypothetical protein